MESLDLDRRKKELFQIINSKKSPFNPQDIQQMGAQFEQSIQIIINLSNIVAAFNNFILEIEEKVKGMQTIPVNDLEQLRTRMSLVTADLQTKIRGFTETLSKSQKLEQGILPPPPPSR